MKRLAVAALTLWTLVMPGAARAGRTDPGHAFVTGDGTLYYERAGHMLGPLAVFVVVFSALVTDDDEDLDACWGAHDEQQSDVGLYADSFFGLESVQAGSSAGLFVLPNLALGMRLAAQSNGGRDPVGGFWGVGPELSWYPGYGDNPLRPFISLSALYCRGRLAGVEPDGLATGPSYQVRTGLSWLGEEAGFYVQASHQSTPLDQRHALAQTRSRWGAGMGVLLYLD